MKRLSWCLVALLAAPAAAQAQEWMPLSTDFFTYLGWGAVSARESWHDLHLGDGGVDVGGAAHFGGFSRGDNFVRLSGDARTALFDRSDAADRLRAGVQLAHQLTDNGETLWLEANGFALPSANRDRLFGEVSANARVRVPTWLPERKPLLLLEAARDFGGIDATYLRGALRLDYKFGVRYGAFLELGQTWNDYPRADSRALKADASDVSLTVTLQPDPARTVGRHPPSYEPFVRAFWSDRGDDRDIVDVGLRIVFIR